MDDITDHVTRIITHVGKSRLTDQEKADTYAQLAIGMRHLVWPILASHMPEYLLRDAVERAKQKQFTTEDYVELIESALTNPATAKEIHDELKDALVEVEQLVIKTLG
jgi:hypothetical protein